MNAHQVLDTLRDAGLSIALTPGLDLKVTPARALTAELRDLIRASKTALVEWLHIQAANDSAPDPDRWCWPHSSAMNGAEIELFTVRLQRYTAKGLSLSEGEALADRLVLRDRDSDDRQVCMECRHFVGHGPGAWRCANWQVADVARRARDVQLPADLVGQLQRCNGFAASIAINPMPESGAAPHLQMPIKYSSQST